MTQQQTTGLCTQITSTHIRLMYTKSVVKLCQITNQQRINGENVLAKYVIEFQNVKIIAHISPRVRSHDMFAIPKLKLKFRNKT